VQYSLASNGGLSGSDKIATNDSLKKSFHMEQCEYRSAGRAAEL